jgi:RNA recognition motif-containing protein
MYHTRNDALAAVRHLNGTKLDNRQLRVDIDYGFEEGRQFGRGRSGGQVGSGWDKSKQLCRMLWTSALLMKGG